MNMKQNFKDFLFNLTISMFIGLFVGMSQIVVIDMNEVNIKILIISIIMGGIIGTISRIMFIYIVGIKQKNVIIAFIAAFMIIGTISCIPCIYYYFIDSSSVLMSELLSILITAELLGMGFCYYSYRRYVAFNSKLMNKKIQLIKKD